jgi:hypothetical protein
MTNSATLGQPNDLAMTMKRVAWEEDRRDGISFDFCAADQPVVQDSDCLGLNPAMASFPETLSKLFNFIGPQFFPLCKTG